MAKRMNIDRVRVDVGEGYIELAVAVEMFALSEEDRAFVFETIDVFNRWRESHKPRRRGPSRGSPAPLDPTEDSQEGTHPIE